MVSWQINVQHDAAVATIAVTGSTGSTIQVWNMKKLANKKMAG